MVSAGIAPDDVSAAVHDAVAEMLGSDLTLQEATAMLDEVDDNHTRKISLQRVSRARNLSSLAMMPWVMQLGQSCASLA